MTALEAPPIPSLPPLVLEAATAAGRVNPDVLAYAIELALTGGADVDDGWWSAAACRHVGPGEYFPGHGDPWRAAVARCADCAVQGHCLAAALAGGEREGIWGGTTASGRRRIRKVLRQAGILGITGEDAYIAWTEDSPDREPPPRIRRRVVTTPWPHQAAAVAAVSHYLRDGGFCQIAMATASGKTHVGVWAATELGVDRVLVLVPSLALVAQTAEIWASDPAWAGAARLAVCSDTGELDLAATTDPEVVRDFVDSTGRAVVFGTYQSSAVLVDARAPFDLTIADEAHHLAGEADKAFAAVLRGEIPTDRTLFMTATPRRYTAHRESDIGVIGMDNAAAFGPRVFDFTLADAIAAGVVADYRVVVAAVERDVFDLVAADPALHGIDAHLLAGAIAVVRTMGQFRLTSCVSFHTRVDRARTFAQLVGHVADLLGVDRPPGPGWSGWVHGDCSVRIRRRLLNRLVDDHTWGVIANAKALGEGIDLPSLDAIAIVDPKNSEVDVLQAAGRALRRPTTKTKVGTVLLPVLLEAGASGGDDPLAAIDGRSLDIVSGVLRALRAHDTDLGSRLDSTRRNLGTPGDRHTGRAQPELGTLLRGRAARGLLQSRVELWLPGGATGALAGALALHVVRESTPSWEEAYGRLLAWIDTHGTARVPQGETGKVPDETGTFSLGAWCTVQRTLRRRGLLSDDRIEHLETLPGWRWDPREERWWQTFDALADYVHTHGHLPRGPAQDTYTLQWQGERVYQFMISCRAGMTAHDGSWLAKFPDRVAALEALPGWTWNSKDAEWEASFAKLEAFVQRAGHASPSVGEVVDGLDVGRWALKQRSRIRATENGTGGRSAPGLAQQRIDRLRALPGWIDDYRTVSDALWEDGYRRTAAYMTAHGRLVPQSYIEPDGHRLGAWVLKQRQAYVHERRRGVLTADRIARLEALPYWSWTPNDDAWHMACAALRRIAAHRLGDDGFVVIPQEPVDGIDLSSWATWQRRHYERGKLAGDRIAALEAVPGWTWRAAPGRRAAS